MKTVLVTTAAVLTVAILAPSDDAAACIHSMRQIERALPAPAVRQTVTQSREAIDAVTTILNEGRNREVIATMYENEGFALNSWAFNIENATDYQREAVYLVAMATIRSNGVWVRHPKPEGAPESLRVANIAWATRALEELAFVGEAAERHLAEAWARDPQLADFAIEKLESLASEQRLYSPFQYEALARLYSERGDEDRADQVRRRISRITKA